MKVFLTQSFGRESEYRRAILAVLSFWAWYKGDEKVVTVIMTDKPDYFRPFFSGIEVDYLLLTTDKIKVMRGDINFIHRMKIALIDEVYQKYPNSDLLYIDSDTFFTQEPSSLLNSITTGTSFMHLLEYEYADYKIFSQSGDGEDTHKDLVSLLNTSKFETSIGEISLNGLATWNAGVLGIASDVKNIIPDVYQLTDIFYKRAPMNGSEQAAFSFMLQKISTVKPAEKYVYHYWGIFKKIVLDAMLENYISKKLANASYADRMDKVKWLTKEIPIAIKINEDAFVHFNNDKFFKGFYLALKTLKYSFFNTPIIKDVLFQVKRRIIK